MNKDNNQEALYNKAIEIIGLAADLPVVRVDRDTFLKKEFSNSPYLDKILEYGPQYVYKTESLEVKAKKIIENSTNKTALISFVAGIPANIFLAVPAGTADVVQYFGFAINLAQKIAYLFGEDNLFTNDEDTVSEEAKIRIIAYLGVMVGASGATALIANVSKVAGKNIGKKVAGKALTKTAWYPLVKKTGAILGQKVTKKTVEKVIAKGVPVVGGFISGGLTYVTFKPMGKRLAKVLAKNLKGDYDDDLELNPNFVKNLKKVDI